MKEFIDKLILRLKAGVDKECVSLVPKIRLCDAIQIAKEVAEEYKGGWIPCSERLPEPGKRYLVSGVWKDEDFEKHSVYDAVYGADGIWHTYDYKPTMYEVIAWQPLPQPYAEQGDNNGKSKAD